MTTYQARRVSPPIVIGLVVGALVIGGAIGAIVSRSGGGHAPTAAAPTTTSTPRSTSPTAPPAPLTVGSVSPASGAVGVPASGAITVTFSTPLSSTSPQPTMDPSTAGAWQQHGAVMTFVPATPFTPLTAVTVTIPGGVAGVAGASGSHLAAPVTAHFRIAQGSTTRLQQILSLLDYSPLTFTPSAAIAPTDTNAEIAAMYAPPAGTFAWSASGWPARLRAMWTPGVDNVFTRGLIMSFQADHALAPNGRVTATLWSTMLAALAANTLNSGGYNYALADKASPESLTIYHDGAVVLRSPANTGIAGSPTPDGTFPVNTRLRRQVMRGTNPGGQHYADLVQYIAYFHGNDAVHYMDRSDYGIPQSLGCVELPLADAAKAWPYLAYGTLVTIIN